MKYILALILCTGWLAGAQAQMTSPYKVDSIKLEGDTTANGKMLPLNIDFNKRIVVFVSGDPTPFTDPHQDAIYINNKLMQFDVNFNCPCVNPYDTSKKSFTLTCNIIRHDTSWNNWYKFGDDMLSVKVDVGTKDKQYSCETTNKLTIKMYSKTGLTLAWIFVITLAVVCILMAFVFKTSLIKDISNSNHKPYSLSRFQLLWWSVIIIGSYVLLYAIRDSFTLLSQSTLILLGISAAGTGFASLIDYNESDKDRHQNEKGESFFLDILSDDNGISIHRFQNFIFTIVFGVIFFSKVLTTGNMPDFGVLELSLMGISTATYVGLKTSENKNHPPAPPDAPTN
jgi:hypothetical protein